MAIEWLTVLKSVPWTEVIGNAPKVAEGAKKLWNAVSRRRAAVAADVAPEAAAGDPDLAALETRLAAVERAAEEFQGQMLASSELIRALADQNGQLIARLEALRKRVFWLSVALGGAVAMALALVFGRPGS